MEQIAGSPRKAAPRPQAEAVTLLLRDWEKYGISERVCYHFDLIEVLTSDEAREDAATTVTPSQPRQPEEQKQQQEVAPVRDDSSQTNPSVCGVVRLLECIPLGRLEKRHRRMLRTRINRFNEMADTVHKMGPISCYAPRRLVRDYRIYDKASAKRLVEKIGEWALGAVEDQIASRLNGGGNLLQTPPGSSGISASTTPRYFLRQSRAK